MKYIITESKLEKTAIHYLNEMYGNLEEYTTEEHPNRAFFMKDNKVYMELEMALHSDILWVEYETICEELRTIFGFEKPEIQEVITKWVEDTYKLNVVPLTVEECPSRYFSKL
jgi:hypothetical protein